MIYEWDDNKLALNLKNHHVHFEITDQFDWTTAKIEPDTRKDYSEVRFIAYGLIDDRLYCGVYSPQRPHSHHQS